MYCINLTHIKFCSLHQSQCKLIILNPETLGLISTCICTCTRISALPARIFEFGRCHLNAPSSINDIFLSCYIYSLKREVLKLKKCPTVELLQFNNFFNDCIIVQECFFPLYLVCNGYLI